MTDDFVYLHWTCRNLEEARKICRTLVEKRWVACANLLPEVESIYLWKGKVETEKEVKVILKTKNSLFDKIRTYIETHGSYEVPEVTMIKLDAINPSYLAWLKETCTSSER